VRVSLVSQFGAFECRDRGVRSGSSMVLDDIAGFSRNLLGADIVTVHEYHRATSHFLPQFGVSGRLRDPDQTLAAAAALAETSAPFLLLGRRHNICSEDAENDEVLCPIAPGTHDTFVRRVECSGRGRSNYSRKFRTIRCNVSQLPLRAWLYAGGARSCRNSCIHGAALVIVNRHPLSDPPKEE